MFVDVARVVQDPFTIRDHVLLGYNMAMRYRLRTLLILMAIAPPIIGLWPAIQRRVVSRAAQISASDVAVVAAVSTVILIRLRLNDS